MNLLQPILFSWMFCKILNKFICFLFTDNYFCKKEPCKASERLMENRAIDSRVRVFLLLGFTKIGANLAKKLRSLWFCYSTLRFLRTPAIANLLYRGSITIYRPCADGRTFVAPSFHKFVLRPFSADNNACIPPKPINLLWVSVGVCGNNARVSTFGNFQEFLPNRLKFQNS